MPMTVTRSSFAAGAVLCAALMASPPAPAATHAFVLTYREFGTVKATSRFTPADGYRIRFEGCYARHSDEAICGFTVRATRSVTITNLANASHGARADGAAVRTCCMFVQGDNRGFPIVAAAAAPAGVAVLSRPLAPGQTIALMLRVPDYRQAGPPTAITFSHGAGDPGVTFPTKVAELP
jgi:hypothetical protein